MEGPQFDFESTRILWIRRWFRTLTILSFNAVGLVVAPLYLFFFQNFLWLSRGQMNDDQSWSLAVPFVSALDIPIPIEFVIFWLLSHLLSILNYQYFENPVTRLSEKFFQRITETTR